MKRENAKALLPIIQAYAEGKKIIVKDKRLSDKEYNWSEVDDCSFNIEQFEYRIKPETTYRPFANAEECWQEMQKHQPFGWVKSTLFKDFDLVQRVTTLYVEINREIIDYKDALDKFTFADGNNFGVKVEE